MTGIEDVFGPGVAGGRKCNICRLNDTYIEGQCVNALCESHFVTVNLEDLRVALGAVDYMSDRSLIGPVDRLGDVVALATMRRDSAQETTCTDPDCYGQKSECEYADTTENDAPTVPCTRPAGHLGTCVHHRPSPQGDLCGLSIPIPSGGGS